MPLTTLTCPICLLTLKLKAPVPEGTRVRCPKCKGSFVAEAGPRPVEPEPGQEPMPQPADRAEDGVELAEEATDSPPRRPPRGEDRPRRKRPRQDEEDDRPRRGIRKKGGVPLWAWLAGGGVLGLMLLCGCGGVVGLIAWRMMGNLAVNRDNYDKIQHNMSPAQVQEILGAPSQSLSYEDDQVQTWSNGDDVITVTFQNGRAVNKGYSFSTPGGGVVQENMTMGP